MSFFSWLKRKLRFNEFSDSICLTRTGLIESLCTIMSQRIELGELVIVVAHFPASFLEIQEAMDANRVRYRIQSEPIDQERLEELIMRIPAREVIVTLGDMFSPMPMSQLHLANSPKVSVIAVERHPLAEHDKAIVNAAREFPYPTSIGFFMALDDPILAPMNADWVGHMLRQMGATERELISSHMVSRRVRSVQRKMRIAMDKTEHRNDAQVESSEAWIEQNVN